LTDSPQTLHARRTWVETYHQTGNAGLTCRRCGISRPTLRKWVRRFEADGEAGLHSQSRRPHRLAPSKRTPELGERVLALRRERNLGPKRIQAELLRADGTRLSTSTIHRVLVDAGARPLKRPKRPREPKRYSRPTAGDRVQVDSMKVARGLVQFTAVDDCTRMRVLGLYPDKTGASAAHFFEERVLKELPFPIARVQSDRGSEFVSHEFIEALRRHRVKLRPNRARAPHLNGKVERSQQTDLVEFYALEIDGKGGHREARDPEALAGQLSAWQRFYNEVRPHGGLGGKTPWRRWEEVAALTPTRAELDARYDPASEPTRVKRGNWVWVQARK
jgi:transposase InsO family protein